MYILGINPLLTYAPGLLEEPAPFPVGSRGCDEDGNEYVFLKAAAGQAIINGDVCFFDASWEATELSTANDAVNQRYAVARATVAVGSFGWFQRYGRGNILVTEAVAAGATLVATATAGQVNDAALTTLFPIVGMTLVTAAAGAGLADAWLNYPMSDFEVHV